MSRHSVVVDRGDTILKTYPPAESARWMREITAYRLLPHATPKLVDFGPGWLEVEKLTPILDIKENRKYADDLWVLLRSVHEAGWWHCDAALINVVVCPERGPLLIDWENLTPATSDVSYDLYGADKAGVKPAWDIGKPTGVYWGGPWSTCPGPTWK